MLLSGNTARDTTHEVSQGLVGGSHESLGFPWDHSLGLVGDLDRIELIIPKDVPFSNPNHGIKDGYLIDKVTNKTIKITDVNGAINLFVKVIRL